MSALVAKPYHGATLITEDKATDALQLWFDELETQLNRNLLGDVVQLPSYTVAELGQVEPPAGAQAFVTNEVDGAVPAFFDGTVWRRGTDRAEIST